MQERTNDDKKQRRYSCGEGDGLRTGAGDEVLALLGTGPWFTLWKPRVFRLGPLRPGTALCARMKDAGRNTKATSQTLFCSLRDGVAAGEQCQT